MYSPALKPPFFCLTLEHLRPVRQEHQQRRRHRRRSPSRPRPLPPRDHRPAPGFPPAGGQAHHQCRITKYDGHVTRKVINKKLSVPLTTYLVRLSMAPCGTDIATVLRQRKCLVRQQRIHNDVVLLDPHPRVSAPTYVAWFGIRFTPFNQGRGICGNLMHVFVCMCLCMRAICFKITCVTTHVYFMKHRRMTVLLVLRPGITRKVKGMGNIDTSFRYHYRYNGTNTDLKIEKHLTRMVD